MGMSGGILTVTIDQFRETPKRLWQAKPKGSEERRLDLGLKCQRSDDF